ncbi:hypothetical protein C8J56DRAFT_1014557 [Mycena floridula]|nr:hypothetical protein C8J56DRAFT_1014557 [Mycena floridula]
MPVPWNICQNTSRPRLLISRNCSPRNGWPSLMQVYMDVYRQTHSFSKLDAARSQPCCPGCEDKTVLNVVCVFLDRIDTIRLCNCTSVAHALLARGLFPCAPLVPSLAVDVTMLDLVRELFVHGPPNTTGWTDTIESFLNSRHYKLATMGTLRKRFTTAFQWYSSVVDNVALHVKDTINNVRADAPDPSHPKIRPSEYLRDRCPLCFGNMNERDPNQLVDVIVCIDACFTQKRCNNNNKGVINNFPRIHPDSVFIPADIVKEMEDYVESIRPSKVPKQKKPPVPAEDSFEGNLRVPNSVLKDCNEKRAKASTQYFSDTALMAMVCRHDRVLWLVNMTSAGERQHYALCLLKQLFRHLPPYALVGLLYDVACILHQSCEKWDFLPDERARILFGVAVFHAYAHQWACQIIYHPRKCLGFGLTDGEGCERLWNLLKALIPSLRVSGFYVKYLDQKSLLNFGDWLLRKWDSCISKSNHLALQLNELEDEGINSDLLRNEWAAQVQDQTKPLPRQSKWAARNVMEAILALGRSVESEREELGRLEHMLDTELYADGLDGPEVITLIDDVHKRIRSLQSSISKRCSILSVDEQANLAQLMDNKFLQMRVNALAVKKRLRNKLRLRKLELEAVSQNYRSSINAKKLKTHTESQVKRKDPGIQQLVRTYNALCVDLTKAIHLGQGPMNAVVPHLIEKDDVFSIDIDNEIWQDVGLDDDERSDIPRWLGDDQVRSGIRTLLEWDRCQEEKLRLEKEVRGLHQWMHEEWRCQDSDESLLYFLHLRADYLALLCVTWIPKIGLITQIFPDNSWGPALEDLRHAKGVKSQLQLNLELENDSDDDSSSGAELLEVTGYLDTLELSGQY